MSTHVTHKFLTDIFKQLKSFCLEHENSVIVYVAGMLNKEGKPEFTTSNVNGDITDLAGMIAGLMAADNQFANMMDMAVCLYKIYQEEGGES